MGSNSSFGIGDVKSPSVITSQDLTSEQHSIQAKRSPLSQSRNDSYSWNVENIRTARGDSLRDNEIADLNVNIELAEMGGMGGGDTDESEVLESETSTAPDVMSPLVSIKIPSPKQDLPRPKVATPKKASRIQI